MTSISCPRILVSPLNWGLGHATRLVPVIHALIEAGAQPIIAAAGPGKTLLATEFPGVKIIDTPDLAIRYSRQSWLLPLYLALQTPAMLMQVKREREWVKKVVLQHRIDAIISDNRYGLCHPQLPSVFITHQVSLQAPRLVRSLANWMHQTLFSRFNACWVPDYESPPGLAGNLAHPESFKKIPLSYLGPLSRFNERRLEEKKNFVLIVLSGPEPQRSILEKKCIDDLDKTGANVILVRGKPGDASAVLPGRRVQVYNHVKTEKLEELMAAASLVICRSGYSTVMDLHQLGAKAVLVPTPGQPEQEYLARHLATTGFAPWLSQKNFSLEAAVKLADSFSYQSIPRQPGGLHAVIRNWLSTF